MAVSKPDPDEARRLLGVGPGAREEEVGRAFRRKAAQWHPDRHSTTGAQEARTMFERVALAREVLLAELRTPGPEADPVPPSASEPGPDPADPWGSEPGSGPTNTAPPPGARTPSDPWDHAPPPGARSPWDAARPYPTPDPQAAYRTHPYPPPSASGGRAMPSGRGSTVAALVTAGLLLFACNALAIPAVILAIMALCENDDHGKAARYKRYAWTANGVNLVLFVLLGGLMSLLGG
ncbi:DnaJ domain-containing protein [Nocardiopsis sp. NPDC006139]|uniref:DnaJ domain-containing protein n=1 Tax=unclassified Nocardiopsis TaxID=2649073 RepID=UPI0033BA5AD3